MKKYFNYILAASLGLMAASCSDFLDEQVPQGTLDENQVKDPSLVESTVISAYAGFTQARISMARSRCGTMTCVPTMPIKEVAR